MKVELSQAIQAQMYGHPNVYPNSEHIKPPMEKERVRVVEAATRTDLKLDQARRVEERMKEIQALRDQASIRYDKDGTTVSPGETQGQFIDLEV
jgi:translation elongation factor P/translation initiation factor 5A